MHNNFSGLFFGLPFTKLNDKFVDSVQSQLSPQSKLLIVCQEGLRSVIVLPLMHDQITHKYFSIGICSWNFAAYFYSTSLRVLELRDSEKPQLCFVWSSVIWFPFL